MSVTYSLTEFFRVLDEIAPLKFSHKLIEQGSYDNSGILIKTHDTLNGAIFSLDLSEKVLKRAKSLGVDTIVTHHPAIYMPIKSLDTDGVTKDVAMATATNKNIISMHLNLDVADGGIDMTLAQRLGAKEYEIIEKLDEAHGYGRKFTVPCISLKNFVLSVKKNLNTKKVIYYGSKNTEIKSVASFCGGGASSAVKAVEGGLKVDAVVTSDIAHHQIKYLCDMGVSVIIVPHYTAEEVGFRKFYEKVNAVVGKDIPIYYFDDKRFR